MDRENFMNNSEEEFILQLRPRPQETVWGKLQRLFVLRSLDDYPFPLVYLNLANLLTKHPLSPSHSPIDASILSILNQSSSLAASHTINSSSSSWGICISKGVSRATIS